jgi:hypothetical protein
MAERLTEPEDEDEAEFRRLQEAATRPLPKPAKAAGKRQERFVKVPLWWAEQAARATHTTKGLVWLLLLHRVWRDGNRTVALPNAELEAYGVTRSTKMRALAELEKAGLIQVERRSRKSPIITLLHL